MRIQDAFKDFLKAQLAPRMRELGFKGSGQKYSYPADDYYIQVGLQKSRYSDSSLIQFTLNIQIIGKTEWEKARAMRAYLSPKPSPNTHECVGINERIGLMTPENLDKWWDYGLDTSELTILDEITNLIQAYVLPEIEKHLNPQAQQTGGGNE